ncbi:MAG: T9SS type A sorting domain-containing protein, partial [Flavobacterium sp.]|nr:T9SS type A sorting domain-containing protein [Flavobacterium sp.]
ASYFIGASNCYNLSTNPSMIWNANYNDEIVYPNPFSRETTIEFSLNETEKVSISVYNELGQLIKTLVMENSVNPGKFKVVWDGTDNSGSEAANGIYLYSISNQNKVIKSGKIILKR